MKNNILKYFEYEKNNLDTNEGDFLRILNKIETKESFVVKSPIKNTFPKNYAFKIKSEYLGWGFGFVGLSMAAFMFFVNTQIQNNNVAQVATISKKDVQDLRSKSKQTIDIINNISSFDNLNKETTQ